MQKLPDEKEKRIEIIKKLAGCYSELIDSHLASQREEGKYTSHLCGKNCNIQRGCPAYPVLGAGGWNPDKQPPPKVDSEENEYKAMVDGKWVRILVPAEQKEDFADVRKVQKDDDSWEEEFNHFYLHTKGGYADYVKFISALLSKSKEQGRKEERERILKAVENKHLPQGYRKALLEIFNEM